MPALLGGWAPLALILAAVVGGCILDFVVLRALYRRAQHRKWTVWIAVLEALQGVVVLWSAAAGIFVALLLFPLRADEEFAANRALVVLVIWSVTVVAARVGVRLVKNYNESRQTVAKTASLFTTLTSIGVYVTGALIVFQYLGVSIAPILAALGVGGLAVALALRDTLANFFSGLQIIASRRLRVGDFVQLENGREGFVTDITWLHTTIREPINNLVVIPNERIASATFTNLSLPTEQTQMSANVKLAYGNDLARVEALTLEVAFAVKDEFAPETPPPVVRLMSADDTGLTLAVLLHVRRYADHIRVRHEFYKRLLVRYEQEGIRLAHVPWASGNAEPVAIEPVGKKALTRKTQPGISP
jgi:small-conductance mechanosensitive channel